MKYLARFVFLLVASVLLHTALAEDSQKNAKQAEDTVKDYRIRIGVEEVRLDAVILDRNGHQVTDLAADDFEIRQDGELQKIASCTYIRTYQQPGNGRPASEKKAKPIPAPMLERNEVRRMIAFVVDNLSMRFEDVHYARLALKKFVETQMQPGDVVAIVQTLQGSAARQLFSNDKQYLLHSIEQIHWFQDPRTVKFLATQYMAIDYFIRALEDMPGGRKALIVMTPLTMTPNQQLPYFNPRLQDWAAPSVNVRSMEAALNQLADRAMRAGVVIHTLDITGLSVDNNLGADRNPNDSLYVIVNAELDSQSPQTAAMSRAIYNDITPYSLSKKTGGLYVSGFNWFVNGIGPVDDALKGYYILTYNPPKNTVRDDFRKLYYHKIKITVKRPGLTVHSRDGFIGTSKSMDASARSPMTVRDALYSPFRNSDLDVHLASGYINDAQKGYLLRYHMLLDGKRLSVVEGKGGINSIYVDVACVTSSIEQFIQDAGNLKYEFRIKDEDIPWIKKHGLRFSLDLPVKNPGAYYVRTAVRDQVSGKAGSAYQFIEIPDLKKNRLSLSSLFIVNRDEDASWESTQTKEKSRSLLYPDMRRDPRKSSALRSYLPGESFEYTAVIYNAKKDGGKRPDLKSQYILYENGKELYRSDYDPVVINNATTLDRIPIRKKLSLENSLQPGDYFLALQVKDNRADEKHNLAVQGLDFKVLATANLSSEGKSEAMERKEIALPNAILDRYAGTYKIGPGLHVTVARQDNRLSAQVTGQVKLPLHPESETKFFPKAIAGAEYEFMKNGKGEVTELIVRRGEEETKALRISNIVVERKEIELSPAILAQYVGVYRLEKGLEMIITLVGGRLYSRIPGQKMIQLCPESETKFFLGSVADAANEFIKNDKGVVTDVIIRQEGNERKARRISNKAPK